MRPRSRRSLRSLGCARVSHTQRIPRRTYFELGVRRPRGDLTALYEAIVLGEDKTELATPYCPTVIQAYEIPCTPCWRELVSQVMHLPPQLTYQKGHTEKEKTQSYRWGYGRE